MATLRGVSQVDIFQEARQRVEREITEIIQCLNYKQTELFEEINTLEKEFTDKQQQKQKEMDKLKSLKSQAENLTENNLLEIQHNVIREIQIGIDKLATEIESSTEARAQIEGYIGRIVSCLNVKKVEMFEEINRLEREYTDKQQQQQKELNKLKNLKSHTEDLGENNLLSIQHKLTRELEHEISALSLTSKLMPDYTISVAWGFSYRDLINSINSSFIEIVSKVDTNRCESPYTPPLVESPDLDLHIQLDSDNSVWPSAYFESHNDDEYIESPDLEASPTIRPFGRYPAHFPETYPSVISQLSTPQDQNDCIPIKSQKQSKVYVQDSYRRQGFPTEPQRVLRTPFSNRGDPDSDSVWPRAKANDNHNRRS